MEKYKKFLKEFEIILGSFKCDKNCPYCTAKITEWEMKEIDFGKLKETVAYLNREKVYFEFLTIGGNGEPSLYDYDYLKELLEVLKDFPTRYKRILSSGNILREENIDKLNLIREYGYEVELTVVSSAQEEDREVLGYNHNYFENIDKHDVRFRVNYSLIGNDLNKFKNDIEQLLMYKNVFTIQIKFLNKNTLNNNININATKQSKWVEDHAFPKEKSKSIVDMLSESYEYQGKIWDYHQWKAGEKIIRASTKESKIYENFDMIYYNKSVVDFCANEKDITVMGLNEDEYKEVSEFRK